MGVNVYKLIVISSLGAILLAYTNCGMPFGQPSPLFFASNIYGGSAELSYDSFERTVYPITRAYCINCHDTQQPAHASNDLKTAHDAIISNFKVNFNNIPASRMVKKLREDNHNCWGDCESNALEMEAAITDWNREIAGAVDNGDNATPIDNSSPIMTTESRALLEEFTTSGNSVKANIINLNVEAAMLKAPMVKAINDGTYLHVPNSTNKTLVSNDASAGTAHLNFVVRQNSSNYKIWALVNAPNTSDNGFYTNITTTTSGVKEWEIPVTEGWEWRELTGNTFNLTAGNHNLEIRQRKDGAKIKQVVISADNNFRSATASDFTAVTLTYDLSTTLRTSGITFKIDVSDYDPYSYKFSNARIVTPKVNVKAKSVKLLVNKSYNPQHSTYTIIDKIATPTDAKISDYSMLVIKENGLSADKISFTFESLKIVTASGEEVAPVDETASLAAYKTTVYPISTKYCISCHTTQNPPHAHEDYAKAHDVVLTQSLVNFTTPASSRLVTKKHNCGTPAQCTAISNEFQAAITEWKKSRP